MGLLSISPKKLEQSEIVQEEISFNASKSTDDGFSSSLDQKVDNDDIDLALDGFSDQEFRYQYYLKEYKEIRISLIKQVFKDVTTKWDKNFVIYPLSSFDEIQIMISRYYFILYEVEAPVMHRFNRFKKKYQMLNDFTLEDFVELDDNINFNKKEYSIYNQDEDHSQLIKKKFSNSSTLDNFIRILDDFNFGDKELVRPSWDTYFMKLAELAAQRSNCMKRAVGAIIVKDHRIVSTGYNGTPFNHRNCNEGGCARCNSNISQGLDLDKCKCLHAEESACLEAGRPKTLDCTIYTTMFPCLLCTKMIIQGGITRLVYNRDYDCELSKEMLSCTDIEVVHHSV